MYTTGKKRSERPRNKAAIPMNMRKYFILAPVVPVTKSHAEVTLLFKLEKYPFSSSFGF